MLKETLNAMKAASAKQTPTEAMTTMLQSRENLTNSDILARVIKVGEKIPDFSLTDARGNRVALAELRQKGAVVISLYRGVW